MQKCIKDAFTTHIEVLTWRIHFVKSFFSEISQKLPVFVTLKSNSRSWNSSICQESSSSSFSAKKLFSALTKLENKTDVVLSYLFVTFFVPLFNQKSLFYCLHFLPYKLISKCTIIKPLCITSDVNWITVSKYYWDIGSIFPAFTYH